mmetsp:Transcript_5163/g.7701  ORF Transcript_5163/g.7701 Transcript_5163/m.7701 type:complete len:113 (+) Transcript_5163:83-421(+)|eukprot:scaffold10360_cov76-Skeletonema_dohrnii-CCMP3373.AAC.1
MKSYTSAIIICAITTQQSAAFQPSISRRALFSNIATTAGAATVLVPTLASAEPKAGKKELLRGGKNASDALHNGTDLNPKEGAVAASLMEKMGMASDSVQGSDPSRAPPKKR